jgi:hypothetical protein
MRPLTRAATAYADEIGGLGGGRMARWGAVACPLARPRAGGIDPIRCYRIWMSSTKNSGTLIRVDRSLGPGDREVQNDGMEHTDEAKFFLRG